jgi:hypothetical protein
LASNRFPHRSSKPSPDSPSASTARPRTINSPASAARHPGDTRPSRPFRSAQEISPTTANGDAAVRILNAWSATLTTVTGNADRFLAAGIYGYQFANAAELMRGYAGFDLARFKTMMLNVFYPLNNDFLVNHNGACITNYWANWDLCNMNSILAIGILCDDGAKYDQAVNYFKSGAGNGAITKAVPFLYNSQGLAQWQESGRDQGHTMMGMGRMGAFCEMAWSQGERTCTATRGRRLRHHQRRLRPARLRNTAVREVAPAAPHFTR